MEYRVLARKWRPQVFEDVLGQEHVVRTLQNAIDQKRVAHAFLFSGPRGVGKTSIARILAKALNCETGPTPIPCNQCVHCREITNGNAIDVREIDGASNRGIDEIRELRENVKFAPVSCRYTIYIIDEVHMLTREAFNALLKTLEEPPGHVIFIFATTETQKVPATILSRCQCFDFRRIPQKTIIENLKKIAGSEEIHISDNGLLWIAEAGDGSLRDSQSIFDQVISYAGFEIPDQVVGEILGRSDRHFLFMLSEAVISRDAGQCLKIINEAYYAGLDMRHFYQTLLGHFRNLLLIGITSENDGLVDLAAEDSAKIRNQASGLSADTLQRYLELLISEEEKVRRSQNPRLNIETVLCRMAFLEPLIPIETVITRMEGIEKRLAGSGSVPGKTAKPESGGNNAQGLAAAEDRAPYLTDTASQSHVRPETAGSSRSGNTAGMRTGPPDARHLPGYPGVQEGWRGYKEFIRQNDPALCAKIESGTCLCCEEGLLRIGFEKGYFFFDDIAGRKQELADHGLRFFGRKTILEIETLPSNETDQADSHNGNGNGNSRAAKNHRIQEIRREALSHPLVRKILDVFPSAEVKEVKVVEKTAAPAGTIPDSIPEPDDAEENGVPLET